MKTKYTIIVTARDIKRGVRKSCYDCPVALAAPRVFGELMDTTPAAFRGFKKGFEYIPIPKLIGKRIVRYDQGKGMKLFSFTVRL